MRPTHLAAFALALCNGAAVRADAQREPARYTLEPVWLNHSLHAVRVNVTIQAARSGRTLIDLPDRYGGVAEHWRYLSTIRVVGARVTSPSPRQRVIVSAPNAPLRITYEVRSAYDRDPKSAGGNPYNGAIVRPAWFSALGDFLFVTPHQQGANPAALKWLGWPSGWTKISTLDDRPATLDQLVESSFLAGPDVKVRRRPISGGQLQLATRGAFNWSFDRYADDVAAVVNAQRAFWNDQTGNYTVMLFQLAPSPGLSSMGGTGRSFGFVQYASADTDQAALFRIIAHEHAHNWIPNRLGRSLDDRPAQLFWLSEGFTDFYTAGSLVKAGLWTPQQFADDLNRTLAGLASSPARNAPNSRIEKDFWSDPAVGQLPYDRGHLFALWLDYQLRQQGNTDLNHVLLAMRDRWTHAPATSKPMLLENLLRSLDEAGFDARPAIARFIEDGATIRLPSDLAGACATVEDTSMPTFEVGFDRELTVKAGLFSGVDPKGPAYAAGLRNGMKRLARLGGQEGDARVPLSYRVLDGTRERVISWLPAGKGWIALQAIRLTPSSTKGPCAW